MSDKPTVHLPDCGYHVDQYWWECTCGNLPHCKVCGRAEYGQEKGMICRDEQCPRRTRREATAPPQVHAPDAVTTDASEPSGVSRAPCQAPFKVQAMTTEQEVKPQGSAETC